MLLSSISDRDSSEGELQSGNYVNNDSRAESA